MSLKLLRNIFIFGTLAFVVVLLVLTVNSLGAINNGRTAELTDAVVNGKKVWQNRNCNDCHTILGIGGYWAPDMTKEATVRDASFLTAFLKDPQAAKPGSGMPNQHLTAAEVDNVVAFLVWVSKIDTNDWPPAPRVTVGGGGPSQGALLYQQKTCPACHRINGLGASGPGPDLSHVGSQTFAQFPSAAAFLDQWLQNPKAVRPSTTMPAVPMSDAERKAIVEYLVGLK